jgi:alpha-L-rhamnosidase
MTISPSRPTFEHLPGALGIGLAEPRVSWKTSAPAGWSPAAYELEVVRDGETTTSGRIESAESVLVPWPAAPLASRERAVVRVRVWGGDETASEWSEPAAVEAGLLERTDWVAVAAGPAW